MRRRARLILACVAVVGLVAAFGLIVGLHLGGDTVVNEFDDIATALAAALACAMSLRAALGRVGEMRRFWLMMAAACGAWASAEVIWAIYGLVLHETVPVPSWADLGYLGAIPLAIGALLAHPGLRMAHRPGVWAVLDGVLLATALLLLSWTVVLGPLSHSDELSTVAGLVTIAYPFGDVVLVFLVVFVMGTIGGADRTPLWFVLGALGVMALSDSVYAYLQETGTYANGNLIDTGWFAAYLGFVLAAYVTRSTGVAVEGGARPRTSVSIVVPMVPVPLALAVFGIRASLGHHVDRTGWWLALVLASLVLARQALVLLDRATGLGRPPPATPVDLALDDIAHPVGPAPSAPLR